MKSTINWKVKKAQSSTKTFPSFKAVIIQIMLLDIVFSLDSVITAVGMVDKLIIMVIAVVIAVIFMMWFSGRISDFVESSSDNKNSCIKFSSINWRYINC